MAKLTASDLEKVAGVLSHEHGIRVLVGGDKCASDGQTITIPSFPDETTDTEFIELVRYYLDHECGHIVGKSDEGVLKKIKADHGVGVQAALKGLEDVRCDNVMSELWVGCGLNIERGAKRVFKKLEGPQQEKERLNEATDEYETIPPITQEPLFQFYSALYAAGSGLEVPGWVADQISSVVNKHVDEIRDAIGKAKTTSDLTALAKQIYDEVQLQEPPEQPDRRQGRRSGHPAEGGAGGARDSSGGAGDGGAGSDSTGGDGGGDAPDTAGDSGDGGKGSDSGASPQQGEGGSADSGGNDDSQGGKTGGSGSASLDLDTEPTYPTPQTIADAASDMAEDRKCVVESELHNCSDPFPAASRELPFNDEQTNAAALEAFRKAVAEVDGPIRQRLSQLLNSEDKKWWRGDQKRGAPDQRQIASLATGTSDRVMRHRVRREAPNTACYLLVDGSSSMTYLIDHAMAIGASFAGLLEHAGHKTKVGIFRNGRFAYEGTYGGEGQERVGSSGTSNQLQAEWAKLPDEFKKRAGLRHDGHPNNSVVVSVVKEWGVNARAAFKRLARASLGDVARGGTPMARGIEIAARDLAGRNEKRKVLMCMCDGEPNSSDNTIRAIQKAEKQGIEVVLIGIKTDCVAALHDKFAAVFEMDNLGGTVMEQLKQALHPGHAKRI
jgi:cobalamin biosynthesis protein CobT